MAISIENTYLTNYSTDATAAAASKLSSQIEDASTDEETLEACQQFEAYMVEQMYKNMQEASKILTEDEEEDDSSSQYVDMFQDNYIQAIAQSMVNSGQSIGIAEKLYESIMKNSGTSAEAVAATATDTTTEG
ncbi:MAG: rod-binding protein [Eubacterium sp.]|nr:rod-binding protein [Eubacterium sp.]